MSYDVIIIGGGIAGSTAAIYLKRANINVLLLESSYIGGQIVNADVVENYPTQVSIKGYEIGNSLKEQLEKLNVEVKYETVNKITGSDNNFVINTTSNTYNAKKIVIATGTIPKKINVENESNYIGKGLSYCATCDGNFFKGRDVAVVGGGNTAINEALYLSNLCNKVYLIHRRDTLRAEESKIDQVNNTTNIELILNSNVTSINGDNRIESITINNEKDINVSGLFIAIGRETNISFIDGLSIKDGYIETNENMETNINGIYAIGDVRVKEVRQLTTASSDGTIVSSTIVKNLKK